MSFRRSLLLAAITVAVAGLLSRTAVAVAVQTSPTLRRRNGSDPRGLLT